MGAPGVLKRLKPKAVSFLRSTWANRTFNRICFCRVGSAIRTEFTTSFENGAAIFPIWSATAGDDAVPVRTTLPSSDFASTASPGNPRVIASRNNETSTSANTSMIRDRLSSCHSTTLLLPAAVAVTTTSLGAVVAVVTTAGLPTNTRVRRGSVWITTEWPTRMCTTWFPPAFSAGTGCCAAGLAGTWAIAGPQRPKAARVHCASRRRIDAWTCRIASLALLWTHGKFGDCYFAVRHSLDDVRVRRFHHGGDSLWVCDLWLW